MSPAAVLELLDWRRRVTELYAQVRALRGNDPRAAHAHWVAERDRLFAAHPQSPLDSERRGAFRGLPVQPYDPAWAFVVPVDRTVEGETVDVPLSGGAGMRMRRVGRVVLPFGALAVFWLEDYAGGVFLPFRDATAGDTTYGGGRYLLDTAKGADLGSTRDSRLVLDFNYAYHPSCHYSPAWSCPLPPADNRLDVRVEAGELAYPD